ncbi:MAG: hypothetical protein KIT27_08525 [Legionellales bacterium]|nr:hypothetical protein [Legionellales bacterium]
MENIEIKFTGKLTLEPMNIIYKKKSALLAYFVSVDPINSNYTAINIDGTWRSNHRVIYLCETWSTERCDFIVERYYRVNGHILKRSLIINDIKYEVAEIFATQITEVE